MSFMVRSFPRGLLPRIYQPRPAVDDAHAARRRYKKDLDLIKPDLVSYNRQKEIAMGLAPGTLVRPATSSTVTNFNPNAGSPSMQVLCSCFSNYWDFPSQVYETGRANT